MTRILIINGNPDPSADRLSHALAKAYHRGAEESGASVGVINIGELSFSLLHNAGEFAEAPTEPDIRAGRAAILAASHLVFIYPLWLGGPPALLKAYMEQLARNYFLLGKAERGFPPGQLKNRSARVIVTMGMPSLLYRLGFGAHGVKAFNRSILSLAGVRPVRTSLFGGRHIQPPGTLQTIEKARQMGRRMT